MKTPIILAVALLAAELASAEDIALRDGRVLINAVVLKQDASTVTVRHSGGFSQIEKSKLPDDLAEKYPIDEEAAEVQHKAEIERVKQVIANQAAQLEQAKKTAALNTAAKAKAKAQERVVAPSWEVRPHLVNERERWKWRTIPLTLRPTPAQIDGAKWEKVYEGIGANQRAPIELTGKLWRISVHQETMMGKLSYVSALVANPTVGHKLASIFLRNSADETAFGNVTGPAILDVVSDGASVRVLIEQQVEASTW